jgi:glycosyltransferase involved in cell wall biosynthesis
MSAERLHVLHVCSNSVVRMGILRSQVVEPMRRLASDPRLAITIVSGERVGERDAVEEERLREELRADGIGLLLFEKRVGPALRMAKPGPLRRLFAPLLVGWDTLRLRRLIVGFARAHRPCGVHARSYVPAVAALGTRRRGLFRLVFDPRGVLPEELAYAQGWTEKSRRYRWWKTAEARILREADAAIALSKPMADHFRATGGRDSLVIPCCVDLERFRPGTRVPPERDPLRLVYLVGVDVPYQTIEQAVAIRAVVARLWPGGAVLRIESPDAEAIGARIADDQVFCASSPREAIPPLLARSDVGVLVRVPSVISRVASPVKFAEYLASGLPVVATAGIGECDGILKERGCGVSLDPSSPSSWEPILKDLVERIRADRETLRAAARRAAEEIFDWEQYLPLLLRAYGLESPPLPSRERGPGG